MAKKKPDVADTDPPEEARPDTTTTPLKLRYSLKRQGVPSRAAATIMDEDLHIVMEVMAKRKLEGSIAQWLAAYKAEIAKAERLRMVEITDPNEYRRVMSEETVVRMAMRYEHTPQTSVADER